MQNEQTQLLIDSVGETLNPIINEEVKKKLEQIKAMLMKKEDQ